MLEAFCGSFLPVQRWFGKFSFLIGVLLSYEAFMAKLYVGCFIFSF